MKITAHKPAKPGMGFVYMAVAAVLFFSGCGQISAIRERITGNKNPAGPGGVPAVQERPVFAVNTTTASQGQIRDYLALSGDIVAGSTVDAYSDVAGKITRVFVSIGNRIGRGDPIAEVDPSRPGMNYVPGIARAPVSGTIVALPAQVGMTVAQTVPLARIASGNTASGNALEIRLYVAERFISKMALRLPCEITLDAYPGEVFQGRIIELSPVVDPSSRTMEVKIGVTNTANRLKAGMFAKVRIITETKNNIVKIPAAALLQRFGENYVFTVGTDPEDPAFQIARKQIVVPGISIDGTLEIQQGLAPGDEVIVRGQTLLEDGVRVNVIDRTAPIAAVSGK
ncbi:MAG: efflux RND transporter periplasmic adaptor subunit [Treponema sp.]|jgi:multidrug efflux pump subunit AcrA (membrane-fusion protein)|nr:efflux RND transporter periplasmic adaptor subunit [Treponema sp.]